MLITSMDTHAVVTVERRCEQTNELINCILIEKNIDDEQDELTDRLVLDFRRKKNGEQIVTFTERPEEMVQRRSRRKYAI